MSSDEFEQTTEPQTLEEQMSPYIEMIEKLKAHKAETTERLAAEIKNKTIKVDNDAFKKFLAAEDVQQLNFDDQLVSFCLTQEIEKAEKIDFGDLFGFKTSAEYAELITAICFFEEYQLFIYFFLRQKFSGKNFSAKELLNTRVSKNFSSWQPAPLYFVSCKRALKMKDPCKMIRFLAKYGADPNLPAGDGSTPLWNATNSECPLEVLQTLLEIGANPNQTARDGENELLPLAYCLFPIFEENEDGEDFNPPLEALAIEKAMLLLQHGADPNFANPSLLDLPPLMSAVGYGVAQGETKVPAELYTLIETLIEKGADVNFTNSYGSTPLSVACEKNLKEIEELLLRHGAKIQEPEEEEEIETPKFQIYCEQCETTNYFYEDDKPPYLCDTCGKELDDIVQYNLGCCYERGDGVEQDYGTAIEWFQKAAKKGNADAQHKLYEWYLIAAEEGNAQAQFMLANCYYGGEGIDEDYDKAAEWYRKSAEQGFDMAQYSIGHCYYHGKGVVQDYSAAVEWWLKAAEQGNAEAQNMLGICYRDGEGVEQNYEKAVEWWLKAAEQGNAHAQNMLEKIKSECAEKQQYKTSFNYLLTHCVIPQLMFSDVDNFYKNILTSPDTMQQFMQKATAHAAALAQGKPDIEPAYAIKEFKMDIIGDGKNSGRNIIMVQFPKFGETADCAAVAIPILYENAGYYTCEIAVNPLNNEASLVLGEWQPSGDSFKHINHGEIEPATFGRFIEMTLEKAYGGKNG